MSSLIVGRHYSKNMVGNVDVRQHIALVKRYMHKSKHSKNNDVSIVPFILTLLKMIKQIDNKFGMKPRILYWSLWGSALSVLAIATIGLEMQWISYLMKA